MSERFRHLARLDIPGGGQVVVDGSHAFVGHLRPPSGTSIIDVADPRKPRVVASVEVPAHTHSHKVRVMGDLMLVNQELNRAEPVKPPIGDSVAKITAETRDAATLGFQGGLK